RAALPAWLGIEFPPRHDRIESGEQEQAGEKPADMGLPRDFLPFRGHGNGAHAEQGVQPDPDPQEDEEARVTERRKQWSGRDTIAIAGAVQPPQPERATLL